MRLRIDYIGKGNGDVNLGNGSLYIVGDRVYSISENGRFSFFSLAIGEWRRVDEMEVMPVGSDHAGDLVDDKIYVTGGVWISYVIELDLALKKTRIVQTLGETTGPTNRMSMTASFADWRREIVFFGGYVQPTQRGALVLSNETHCFNVDSKSWELLRMKGKLPLARTGHSAAMKGFNLYVYGGYNQAIGYMTDIAIAHLRVMGRPHWTMPKIEGGLPPGRVRAVLKCLSDNLVLFGGFSRDSEIQSSVELYCPRTRQWRRGKEGDHTSPGPGNSVEVTGSCRMRIGYPMGVEAADGVFIFSLEDVYKISIENDY